MLIVIDTTHCDDDIVSHWKISDFPDRLRGLAAELVFFDPHGRDWAGGRGFRDLAALRDHAEKSGRTAIAHVGGEQLFLDTDIAAQGLKRFRDEGGAYFTQWEHCRLPVGAGIRAFDLGVVEAAGGEGFDGVLARLFKRRGELHALYDDTPYVSFDQSKLDARFGPGLRRIVEAADGAIDWSLDGFLGLAAGAGDGMPRVQPAAGRVPIVDERGLPAAYGFESSACAEFPTYVMFDMTNKCNAKCIHCPHSVGFQGAGSPLHLDKDTFRDVVEQCVGRQLDFVRVTADGEPLLHPWIWDLLNYTTERGVGPVGLTTNGSALNAINAQRLLDSGIFMVDVSLDAASRETFELVRAGLSYERTRDNVLRLVDLRNAQNAPLKVMVSFVNQKENTHELEEFKAFWEPLVDKVLIREMHTNVGMNDNTASGTYADERRYPCPHLFRRTVINYDGVTKFCPIDWDGHSKYRPVAEESLEDAWHSEFYRSHRMQHLNNRFSPDSPCATCEDWKSTPWELGYEKVIGELGRIDET